MAIYCYFGNNIIYTVCRKIFNAVYQIQLPDFVPLQFDGISTSVYCSKFIAFDRKTSQALLLIMAMTGARRISITGTGLVKFEMSLQTLLKVRYTVHWSCEFRIEFRWYYGDHSLLFSDSQNNLFNYNAYSLNVIGKRGNCFILHLLTMHLVPFTLFLHYYIWIEKAYTFFNTDNAKKITSWLIEKSLSASLQLYLKEIMRGATKTFHYRHERHFIEYIHRKIFSYSTGAYPRRLGSYTKSMENQKHPASIRTITIMMIYLYSLR